MIQRYLKSNEDSFTALVFKHLLHLPIEVAWNLLRNASATTGLPIVSGEPRSIEFWPKWDPTDTANSRFIEPDLFLRFGTFDLIVESKRWDEKQQNANQWRNQIRAYFNEWGNERQELHYLALGGLWDPDEHLLELDNTALPTSVHIQKCLWRSILEQAQLHLRDLERHTYASSQSLAERRIFVDLIEIFAHHGFSTGKWYHDFSFSKLGLAQRLDRNAMTISMMTSDFSSKSL